MGIPKSQDRRNINKRLLTALKRIKPFRCEICGCELYQRKRGDPERGGRGGGIERDREQRLATVDHIKPRSKGGTDDMSNVQLACKGCNCRKGTR